MGFAVALVNPMRAELMTSAIRGAGLGVGLAAVIGMVLLVQSVAAVILLVFMSILLASALEPLVLWLRARLPLARGATIVAVYLGFFAVMIGFALVVLPAAIGQLQRILVALPPVFEDLRGRAASIRPTALSDALTALVDAVAIVFRPAPPPEPDEVVEVGTAVAEAALALTTMLTLVYFWLVEHARWQRYVLAFLPADRRQGGRRAWNEVEDRLGSWVRGQLVLMGAIGLATGIAYTILGVPGALLLGLIAAVAEAIPIVGPLLGAVPAILVAASVSPELAFVVAGVYGVLQLIEGSVLVPLVMRHAIGISPFLVLVSLLIGGAAGGLIGALIAVPIAASIEIVLSRLQARETPVAQDAAGIDAGAEGDAESTVGGGAPERRPATG